MCLQRLTLLHGYNLYEQINLNFSPRSVPFSLFDLDLFYFIGVTLLRAWTTERSMLCMNSLAETIQPNILQVALALNVDVDEDEGRLNDDWAKMVNWSLILGEPFNVPTTGRQVGNDSS